MNPVVHFELPGENRDRMSEFYTKVFGWEANKLGEDMGNYTVVMTAESDKKGPLKPGAINGGLYLKTPEMGPSYPSVVIAVDDIHQHMKKITREGGKVLGEPMEIPGVGIFVSFIDKVV